VLAVVAALAGCSSGASQATAQASTAEVSLTSRPTVTPSVEPTPSYEPTPSVGPTPTATSSVRSDPTGQPRPPVDRCESEWAITTVDTLRVRSQPNVGDESIKHEPLLESGTELHILDGPVAGSGYWWYEVSLTPGALRNDVTTGWIAAGDRDGTPWIVCMGID